MTLHKLNIKKSVVFLYVSNEQSKYKVHNSIKNNKIHAQESSRVVHLKLQNIADRNSRRSK